MGTEKTIAMIKPEGMLHQQFIHHRLSQHGLTIVDRKMIVLDEKMLSTIYADLPPVFKAPTMAHLNGQTVEVLVIQGENAIRAVMNEVGDHKDPEQCDARQIRSVLAKKTDSKEMRISITPRLTYCKNFVHRANGPREVEVQAKLFGINLK